MGFGYLLLGYLIAYPMSYNPYGAIFKIIGYAVLFSALSKLYEYKHSFRRTFAPLLLLTGCAILGCVPVFAKLLDSTFSLPPLLNALVNITEATASFLFQMFTLLSVLALGKDTECEKVSSLAQAGMVVLVIYFAADALALILPLLFPDFTSHILVLTMSLFSVIYPFFLLIIFYNAYIFICAPEDEAMPRRVSKFGFVNRYREKEEAREKARETEAAKALEAIQKKNDAKYKRRKKK